MINIDLPFILSSTGTIFFMYIFSIFLMQQYYIKVEEEEDKKKQQISQDQSINKQHIQEIKYEDKYLHKFDSMDNIFSFQEEDRILEQEKMKDLLDNCQEEELTEEKINEIKILSYDYMLTQFLKKNKNNYIIENTPLGNVAMNFNVEKGSFEYYSDKNIPYRFLETVARKYAITFHCKPLYICMDNEIQMAEQKMKEKKELLKFENSKPKTKDIFANFKNQRTIQPIQMNRSVRNNDTKTNTKTNPGFIHPKVQNLTNNNTSQILKENANRYTHQGKFSNFILLKVTVKQDKKTNLSYRDYIKLNKVKI